MYVDDRLATVLNARADGNVAMRIQYRQLLDLIGTTAAGERGDLLDAAHVRLGELARLIPAEERARVLAEPGIRLRNPRLVADLADDYPVVAIAAIRAARLSSGQWLDLVPALPLAARGFLRRRTDLGAEVDARLDQLGVADRALPGSGPAASAPAAMAQPEQHPGGNVHRLAPRTEAPAPAALATGLAPPAPAAIPQGEGIGAIVRRIEAFRRSRESGVPHPSAANDAPLLPLDDGAFPPPALRAFAFGTDAAGRISWAEPTVAPMVVGMLLPVGEEGRPDLALAFRRKLPIRAAAVTLAGAPAIGGDWQLDAAAEFDRDGNFTGYLGRFRRLAPPTAPARNGEGDRLRQILHELRTPVNAIQGFAELIQQQLFGATPHEYRALAAGIAGDAARMLAGFEELDRLARLEGGGLVPEPGSCDLAMIVAGVVHQLESFTATRSSGFAFAADAGALTIALQTADAEHLCWRLLATLAGLARPGEILGLEVRRRDRAIRLVATLPEALAALPDPCDAAPPQTGQAISAGMFGSGFTLRLARAEARAAGGGLDFADGRATLDLPLADAGSASIRESLPDGRNDVASTLG